MKVITNPNVFFEESSDERLTQGAFFIVTLSSVSTIGPIIVNLYYQYKILPPELEGMVLLGGVISIVTGLLFTYGFWLLYSVILHAIAVYFGGKASFRSTVITSAYGFLPLVLSGLFLTVSRLIVLDGKISEYSVNSLEQLQVSSQNHLLLGVAIILTVACIIWRGMLWGFAVKNTHELSLSGGLDASVVPTSIAIIVTVYQIF